MTPRTAPSASSRATPIDFSRTVPAPPVDSLAYDLERMSVICT